jgi:hypothetical protein
MTGKSQKQNQDKIFYLGSPEKSFCFKVVQNTSLERFSTRKQAV